MEVIPILIPDTITIPEAISFPSVPVMAPTGQSFSWPTVPMYVEDIPAQLNSPSANVPLPNEETLNQSTEEILNQSAEERLNNEINTEDQQTTPPLNLVPELAEVQTWDVPLIGVEIPVPRAEILVTATATAGISSVVAVSGTLFATTLFRRLQPILKPIFKALLKKLAKLRKKNPPPTWARQRLLQKRLKASQ